MTRQALEGVIGRAVLDAEFRTALFADPDSTLGDFELTEAELMAIRSVDAESLDACGSSLGRRIRKRLTGEQYVFSPIGHSRG